MINRLIFTSALLLSSSIVQAIPNKSVDYQTMYSKCLKEAGRTNNASVLQCSQKTFEASEQEINHLYSQVYRQVSAQQLADAKQFELSQKSWLSYRNTHCKLAGAYVGSPMYSYCPMHLNILRIAELRELARE